MLCKWDRSTMTVTQPRSAILVKSGATLLLISTQLTSQFRQNCRIKSPHVPSPNKVNFPFPQWHLKEIDFIFGEIWGSQQK